MFPSKAGENCNSSNFESCLQNYQGKFDKAAFHQLLPHLESYLLSLPVLSLARVQLPVYDLCSEIKTPKWDLKDNDGVLSCFRHTSTLSNFELSIFDV
jgi:hypothetical protein